MNLISEASTFGTRVPAYLHRLEQAMGSYLPSVDTDPDRLHQAMRYACRGGKHLRALLIYASGEALGVEPDRLDPSACAIEFIHAYSLVHDDLPAMDNDDLRRGYPTVHKAYDEATAILVGDALQTLAFELLARDASLPPSSSVRLQLIVLLADASGSFGMAGGQAIDMAAQGQTLDLAGIEQMHDRKTGALIRASVMMAAECAPALDSRHKAALADFAAAIGLAFQIQDDLLDVIGETAVLGKTAGADKVLAKPTYPAVGGVAASRSAVSALHQRALEALQPFGQRAEPLRLLSDWLLARRH